MTQISPFGHAEVANRFKALAYQAIID